ncbi:hypothetical protein EDB92DRAFT_1144444 [Lactarius akahatsu]|uniref:Uncharacterized protein n=1 Tax=Lactarius akahatsu TaxID=416441 RepID=A0AAD4LH72_9AGAM|nr:hypothetical protein EDB92DRAFT_1144444 [Lactarius akahatsu]
MAHVILSFGCPLVLPIQSYLYITMCSIQVSLTGLREQISESEPRQRRYRRAHIVRCKRFAIFSFVYNSFREALALGLALTPESTRKMPSTDPAPRIQNRQSTALVTTVRQGG